MNVLEAALERIEKIYSMFDTIIVAFSGGKDSTTVLQLTLEVARKLNKLPVTVAFIDEEAITYETVEYVRRLSSNPDIELLWYCLETKHRNACSRTEVFWFTWDKEKQNLWVRDLPEEAITSLKGFVKGITMLPDVLPLAFDPSHGKVACLSGIRAQESIRRKALVTNIRSENYIGEKPKEPYKNHWPCYPIFDWKATDVWRYAGIRGFDYNTTYDILSKHGVPLSLQRCTPPWGEEPLGKLDQYAECFPELWHKMTTRVPGCNSGRYYGKTSLYGRGRNLEPPEGMNWEQWTLLNLDRWGDDVKGPVALSLKRSIVQHQKRTARPMPQSVPDPASGLCWKFLSKFVLIGDFKQRKLQTVRQQAWKTLEKMGIHTYEERCSYTDETLTLKFETWKALNNIT